MQDKTLKIIAVILAVLIGASLLVLGCVLAGKSEERDDAPHSSEGADSTEEERPVGGPEAEDYKIDIAPFIEAIDAKDGKYLLLVNPAHSYGTTVPDDLTGSAAAEGYSFSDYRLNRTALAALTAMCLEAEADGVSGIDITSAYRSYDWQATLFDRYCDREMQKNPSLTREEAEAIVATYSCRAGTSEHQTGLAVDLRVRGDDQSLLNESFADTQAGRWLAENCARFGFVLRFPKDKTSVTGIQFEPWHFRFVGYRAANEMTEKGMCLEEYSAYLDSLSAE